MPRQKKNSEMNETETKVSKKQTEKKVEGPLGEAVAKDESSKKRTTKSVKEKKQKVEAPPSEASTALAAPKEVAVKEPVVVQTEVVSEVVKPTSVDFERVGHEGVESTSEGDAVKTRKTRVNMTTENVLAELSQYCESIEVEIVKLKQSKTSGIKFLKGLNKNLKNLKMNLVRVMKKKTKTTRLVNTNAGFSKPVRVSDEMAKFVGLDSSEELVSRVFVTKYLCQYIKNNELQNPSDKRQILADAPLSTLLGFYAEKETEPLTYYRMQTFMRPHFV